MSFLFPEKINPALQDFFFDQISDPDQFKTMIHPQDEMYQFALVNQKTPQQAALRYYYNGQRIIDAVSQILDWYCGGFHQISSFLDFASGYGRSTRFLVQKLPANQVWMAEIDPKAVQFQVEQLGVQGIQSHPQPNALQVQQQFDCILACSFFSHLPEITFSQWLKVLYELLSPDGILMFSVHDRSLLPEQISIETDEILFIPESESRSLAGEDYGTSYVGEAFVRNIVNTVTNQQALTYRIPQGICRYQDLYLVTKNPRTEFSQLQFSHHPQGQLEQVELTADGILKLSGWVSEINRDSQIETLTVLQNRQPIIQFKPTQSAWSCQIEFNQFSPDDNLLIKVRNSRGLEWVFVAAPLGFLCSSTAQI